MNDIERYNIIVDKLKKIKVTPIDFTLEYFIENKDKTFINTKIKFKCSECNSIFERICYNMLREKSSKLCLMCSKKYKKSKKFTLEEVRERIAKKGVELISDSYTGETSKITIRCGCGELVNTTYASIRNSGNTDGKYRCKDCAKEYSSMFFRKSFKDIVEYFRDNGCVLLSNEGDYTNVRSEVEFIASCGHKHKSTLDSFQNARFKMCGVCTSKIHKGENSYNWKGGIESENIRLRKTYESKQWSKSVFKKDDYTCQYCNQRGGKLNAHHLDGWNWCKERRFDIDNGVTLCKSCHDKFHNIYGSGENTEQEYNEWVSNLERIKV